MRLPHGNATTPTDCIQKMWDNTAMKAHIWVMPKKTVFDP